MGEREMGNAMIIRKLEKCGRITLPIEVRKKFKMVADDLIEIYTEGDTIILKKYEPFCLFCGESTNVRKYKDKKICLKCLEALRIMR
jgi:transcriptional pleiotropic regulator of transition state genes